MNFDEAELKKILGNLYKELSAFKLTYKEERESDKRELSAWSQSNLIQNQLITRALETIDRLTQTLNNQEISRQEFEKLIETLKEQLIASITQSISSQKPSAITENLEYKGLKSEIIALKSAAPQDIVTKIDKLEARIIGSSEKGTGLRAMHQCVTEIKSKIEGLKSETNYLKVGFAAFIGCSASLLIGTILANWLPPSISPVHAQRDQIANSYTKIERIEAKLKAK